MIRFSREFRPGDYLVEDVKSVLDERAALNEKRKELQQEQQGVLLQINILEAALVKTSAEETHNLKREKEELEKEYEIIQAQISAIIERQEIITREIEP